MLARKARSPDVRNPRVLPRPRAWLGMPLPAATRYGILPTEMEYVASSETLVDILPLVSLDRVRLLSGTYGPFQPPAHAVVPLWLAISLRKKRKCVIIPPEWLSVGKCLCSYVQMPSQNTCGRKRRRCPSPHCRFISWQYRSFCLNSTYKIATYTSSAAEDIPSSSKIRSLLKDLREARQSKILAGLEMINGAHLEMTNISSLEICELRPFFRTALKQLHSLQASRELKEEPTTHEDEEDITVRRH